MGKACSEDTLVIATKLEMKLDAFIQPVNPLQGRVGTMVGHPHCTAVAPQKNGGDFTLRQKRLKLKPCLYQPRRISRIKLIQRLFLKHTLPSD